MRAQHDAGVDAAKERKRRWSPRHKRSARQDGSTRSTTSGRNAGGGSRQGMEWYQGVITTRQRRDVEWQSEDLLATDRGSPKIF